MSKKEWKIGKIFAAFSEYLNFTKDMSIPVMEFQVKLFLILGLEFVSFVLLCIYYGQIFGWPIL